LDSKKFAKKIADLIFNKKGYDVRIIDLQNIASFTDYFIICSADSDTQVKAISDEIDKNLRDEGIKCWHKEGLTALSWVLMDYVDVVVHVFKKEARDFYNIEKLWGDAPSIEVEDPALKKVVVKPKANLRTTTKKKTQQD
jgi:ribosome-associated protein